MIPSHINNYLSLFRFDHIIKQLFVIPGIILAIALGYEANLMNIVLGLFCVQFAASSNYIINEWLDRKYDLYNPKKKNRPSVTNKVKKKVVFTLYGVTTLSVIFLSYLINLYFFYTIVFFLIMGILYNVEPFRTKDVAFLDVISESINNPIRLLLGYFMFEVGEILPSSLIIFYWSAGAFLMTCKRLAEYNSINKSILIKYRKSFENYSKQNLMMLIYFFSMIAISMITIFMIKYKIEFIFFIISLIILFVFYFNLSLKPNSIVQNVEYLYKEKSLMMILIFIVIIFLVSLFLNFELLEILEKPLNFSFYNLNFSG